MSGSPFFDSFPGGITISGSDDGDLVFGTFGNDYINGNGGNDLIFGLLRHDTIAAPAIPEEITVPRHPVAA